MRGVLVDQLLAGYFVLVTVVPGATAFALACWAVAVQRRHAAAGARRCSYAIAGLSAAFFAVCWTVHIVAGINQALDPGAWVVRFFWLPTVLAYSVLAIVPIVVLTVYVSPVHRIVSSPTEQRLAAGFASLLLVGAIAAQLWAYHAFGERFEICAEIERRGDKPDPLCSTYHCMALVPDHRCM
jgi:hypothetical protein